MPGNPADTATFDLVVRILLGWSLFSLGTSLIGLYAKPRDFYRGFWFMSGLWGLIDGAIALGGLLQQPMPTQELRSILGLNAALDIAYLATGFILLTRPAPVLKGFGAAILFQGAFLMIFDITFWFLCQK